MLTAFMLVLKKKKRFVYNTLYVYKRQLTYQS
jgi:hypothetical protein